ncbi:MAG TPA: right-handed parallel beta-helix repeat-containing protein [bacterium]|nr:right-handed parallel beta-helix repeat-containing protein [bacterium]
MTRLGTPARLLGPAILILMLAATYAMARTWTVRADRSGDVPTVKAALDSARAGDTVLVYPGQYEVIGGGVRDYVTLVSWGGRDVTTLYNDTEYQTPIIYLGCNGVVVEGFCFKGMRPTGFSQGIVCYGCDHPTQEPDRIISNRLVNLMSEDWGGGICVYEPRSVVIADNIFEKCVSYEAGGAIFCGQYDAGEAIFCDQQASAVIQGNQFFDCESQFGGAIGCTGASAEITDNAFVGNRSWKHGGAVWGNFGASLDVEGNTFSGNQAPSGGGLLVQRSSCGMSYNVFDGNQADFGGGIVAGLDSHVTCELSTFYGNSATEGGAGIYVTDSGVLEARSCILTACAERSAIECVGTVISTLDCNDLWGNWGDYAGCTPGPMDFHEDPLVCSVAAGAHCLRLQDCSPCVAHAGCGQVGAYGIGCNCGGGPSLVVPATWGAIKSMYK